MNREFCFVYTGVVTRHERDDKNRTRPQKAECKSMQIMPVNFTVCRHTDERVSRGDRK